MFFLASSKEDLLNSWLDYLCNNFALALGESPPTIWPLKEKFFFLQFLFATTIPYLFTTVLTDPCLVFCLNEECLFLTRGTKKLCVIDENLFWKFCCVFLKILFGLPLFYCIKDDLFGWLFFFMKTLMLHFCNLLISPSGFLVII